MPVKPRRPYNSPQREGQANATHRRILDRSWLVADILRSAHGSDESLAGAWALWQQRHLAAIGRAIAALHARGALRQGLAPVEAVDAFYALAGTDVYRALVRERGWSPDRYERWLFRLACTELLGVAPADVPTDFQDS